MAIRHHAFYLPRARGAMIHSYLVQVSMHCADSVQPVLTETKPERRRNTNRSTNGLHLLGYWMPRCDIMCSGLAGEKILHILEIFNKLTHLFCISSTKEIHLHVCLFVVGGRRRRLRNLNLNHIDLCSLDSYYVMCASRRNKLRIMDFSINDATRRDTR